MLADITNNSWSKRYTERIWQKPHSEFFDHNLYLPAMIITLLYTAKYWFEEDKFMLVGDIDLQTDLNMSVYT